MTFNKIHKSITTKLKKMKARYLKTIENTPFSLIMNEETQEIGIALKNHLATNQKFENELAAIKKINARNIPWELILNLIVMIVKEILEEVKKRENQKKDNNEENKDNKEEN